MFSHPITTVYPRFLWSYRVAEKEKGNPIVTVHDKLGRVGLEITPLKLFWERYEGRDGVVRFANRLCYHKQTA